MFGQEQQQYAEPYQSTGGAGGANSPSYRDWTGHRVEQQSSLHRKQVMGSREKRCTEKITSTQPNGLALKA